MTRGERLPLSERVRVPGREGQIARATRGRRHSLLHAAVGAAFACPHPTAHRATFMGEIATPAPLDAERAPGDPAVSVLHEPSGTGRHAARVRREARRVLRTRTQLEVVTRPSRLHGRVAQGSRPTTSAMPVSSNTRRTLPLAPPTLSFVPLPAQSFAARMNSRSPEESQ